MAAGGRPTGLQPRGVPLTVVGAGRAAAKHCQPRPHPRVRLGCGAGRCRQRGGKAGACVDVWVGVDIVNLDHIRSLDRVAVWAGVDSVAAKLVRVLM
eukprot:11679-Chlamydomonas_euryale.AAC.10